MAALIAASAIRTCLGDGAATFAALLMGKDGRTGLRAADPKRVNVAHGYHVPGEQRRFAAGDWLAGCVTDAVRAAGLDPSRERVVALVGTGLRELGAVEEWAQTGADFDPDRLHFGSVLRACVPGIADVVTIVNACSAGLHALALAQDLLADGEADAVIVGGVDSMTQSMLAMIGRVADAPTDRVRPFDEHRQGVLLGDGAAALILVPDRPRASVLGRVLGTGLSCDAWHETAPDVAGIGRAIRDAHTRAGVAAADVDLVVAHGTGTALNDPAECAALRATNLAGGGDPLVTAVKGAVGHTSGTAGLVNVDVALRALAGGVVPPVCGLETPLAAGAGLRFATTAVRSDPRLAQVHAFGFGGVNAVTLLEPVS